MNQKKPGPEELRARKSENLRRQYRDVHRAAQEDPQSFPGAASLLNTFSEEDLIAGEIDKVDLEYFVVPDEKYKDWSKTISKYHARFLSYLPELATSELEQLRKLVPYFPVALKQIRKEEVLPCIRNLRIALFDSALSARTVTTGVQDRINRDYLWHEYMPVLEILGSLMNAKISGETESIAEEVTPHYLIKTTEVVSYALHLLPEGDKREIVKFVALMKGILAWAEKYNSGCDWLVEQLLYCLRQLYETPEIDIRRIVFAKEEGADFDAITFRFEHRGWSAGSEKPSEYRTRVTKEFLRAVETHLIDSYRILGLESAVTGYDLDFDRVRWLVRWNINHWTAKRIANEHQELTLDARTDNAVYQAVQGFRRLGFPVRQGR